MARTIGVKYKNQVKRIVKQAQDEGLENATLIAEHVVEQMPAEAFDTWEGAYNEIEQLAFDTVMEG